ncbi:MULTISPECIES: hypothetical protein [Methylomonas]|uniref:Nucleoside 2-deoxyribosyltransferase n=1 Tax=Methylomonas koyamae TaxID=702114 RepID=A0A177NTX7_9GAMM|nr:hypothetical protein [Methylomonas koyamae]OAI20733.1 hypothetical protein A1355_23765 [Methylomonas koyamae]
MTTDSKARTAFVATPIGSPETETRRATDGLLDAVIAPVLESMGFVVTVAHRMSQSGSINAQVLKHVLGCDLLVANLSELNPNVMYELAVRHCARKPTVILAQTGTRLPFDVTDQRTLFYRNDMSGVVELARGLREFVEATLSDTTTDNPVYQATFGRTLCDNASSDLADAVILRKLDAILSSLSELGASQSRPQPVAPVGAQHEYVAKVRWRPSSTSSTDEMRAWQDALNASSLRISGRLFKNPDRLKEALTQRRRIDIEDIFEPNDVHEVCVTSSRMLSEEDLIHAFRDRDLQILSFKQASDA